MTNSGSGYEIIEGEGFLTKVRERLGSVERWDELRAGLDWLLSRDPMDPAFAVNLTGTLWVVRTESHPAVALFYEVAQAPRTVTYVDVHMID